jgi:hypothetical protein
VNGYQVPVTCPQCGNATAVHSIQELAALAKARLAQTSQGYQGVPQPGWAADPQPGWAANPQPGWAAEPQPGPLPGPRGRRRYNRAPRSGSDYISPGDDLAGLAITGATRFIGRAIGRRVQAKYTEQILPALAARAQAMLQTQIAIADRHPDVCACLNDGVIFLAGGRRTLPMPNLQTLTVEQADSLVATLRSG